MKKITIILTLLILAFTSKSQLLNGKVIRVVDGDTYIFVSTKNDTIRVRDAYANTPEGKNGACSKEQPFYKESKAFATKILEGKTVVIKVIKKDIYGRTLAATDIGGEWFHTKVIKQGFAWDYNQKGLLYLVQKVAQVKRIGLWKAKKPINPSIWLKTYSTRK